MKHDIFVRIVCDEDDIESAMQKALEEIAIACADVGEGEPVSHSSEHEMPTGGIVAIGIEPYEATS